MAEGIRVAPPRVFPAVDRAPKPPMASPSADAYRQLGFVLGQDVDAVVRGLEAESAIADASSDGRHRTQAMASALGPWSRSWLCRSEALQAVAWGNYVAAFPLVRAAADALAARLALLRTGAAEWDEWLAAGGIERAPEEHATEFELHPFRSGETLAAEPELGRIYRQATDLALPHFGSTLLLAGSESGPGRVAITFGDRDFHHGLAELALGWLLALSALELEGALAHDGVFRIDDVPGTEALVRDLRALVERPGRCRIEEIERGGMRRYLVHDFRRRPQDAARRILL